MSLNEQQKEKIGVLFDIINKLRDQRNSLIWDCGFSTDDWDSYNEELIEVHEFFFEDKIINEDDYFEVIG